MVIGKCADAFRGIFWLGGGITQGELSLEEFVMGEEYFNEGGAGFFFSNIKKKKK